MARRAWAVLLAAVALGAAAAPGDGLGHPTQPLDRDHDTINNPDDNCPDDFNRDQVDTDHDGTPGGSSAVNEGGDACDTDDDADRVDDPVDNCALIPNTDQRDTDSDGIGDLCDEDDDADGVPDRDDRCVKVPDPDQKDADDDFIGDACDPDSPQPARRADVAGVTLGPARRRRPRGARASRSGSPARMRARRARRRRAGRGHVLGGVRR